MEEILYKSDTAGTRSSGNDVKEKEVKLEIITINAMWRLPCHARLVCYVMLIPIRFSTAC